MMLEEAGAPSAPTLHVSLCTLALSLLGTAR